MKLLYTPIKHYVHTVEAVLNYAGLRDRVEPVPTRPFDIDTPLPSVNPLGKVPTLILDDGNYLAGGPVIYEYLDSLHDRRRLHPAAGPERFQALRRAWLADGMFDSFVQIIIESWQEPSSLRQGFVMRQWQRVARCLDQMDADVDSTRPLDIGHLRTVGAIQFLVLKTPTLASAECGISPDHDCFAGRPRLGEWFASVEPGTIFHDPLIKEN
ncbi:MAG: glutathione S-transferase family protein [Steroidobacteraceae bacterium]